MPFEFFPTSLPDVILIKPKVFKDSRGFFLETYKQSDFQSIGIKCNFVQDNFSYSEKNVLRGLHFQKGNKAQGKLVRVTQGEVFDVAVDIRVGSPTFGKYVAVSLSKDNHNMLWIPPGFAHGFLCLEEGTQLHYKCTDNEFDPASECTLAWDDPDIGIEWPITNEILLSSKDINHAVTISDFLKIIHL